ncbi:glycosyltransferase family 1 protein [Paenibacillus sp. HB172176]|uniref:glycosyltransferase family 1 protein n=1 Tax=Paenibacillus sp. HB172176 TaxID=2493690 RepID=UPI00143AFF8E|nr:glycosyltransferase family 1 protein [Paenibacillus sp. HB172176]
MASPLRVLHAVVNMNRGGAETLLMNLYRHVDRKQLQFDFLTNKEGVFDSEILSMGGRIHRIPYIDQAGHFGYRRELREFFKANSNYRVIHSHMDRMSGFVLHAAKKVRTPVRIAHSHNTESEGGIAGKLYKRYAGSKILSSATHQFACSEAAGHWLFRGGRRGTEILKNGVDIKRFAYSEQRRSEMRDELGISGNTLIMGHVGRFAPQKNHSMLLDIFKRLNEEMPDSRLMLAGDGPLRKEMEEKAERLGISRHVKFLGVRSDVEHLLLAFDVFVFPSHHEGLPVTLIEAQANGLPCVVSDAITYEADLRMGLMGFASNARVDEYVELILNAARTQIKRRTDEEGIRTAGYDIRETAGWLQRFYQSECEVKEAQNEDINRIYANL